MNSSETKHGQNTRTRRRAHANTCRHEPHLALRALALVLRLDAALYRVHALLARAPDGLVDAIDLHVDELDHLLDRVLRHARQRHEHLAAALGRRREAQRRRADRLDDGVDELAG